MRMRRVSEYEAHVRPDGTWSVTHAHGTEWLVSTEDVASGKAKDQRLGELAARCAIEDHKATKAKARVTASMVQHFTVQA